MTDSTNDLINDLIKRLLGLARAEHDDLSVAEEAAAHILALSPQSDRVLVPREPTPEMIKACNDAIREYINRPNGKVADVCFSMLAAATESDNG